MKKLVKGLYNSMTELALLAGAATVAVGTGMIYFPAGLITGGVLIMIGAVLSIRGEGDDE